MKKISKVLILFLLVMFVGIGYVNADTVGNTAGSVSHADKDDAEKDLKENFGESVDKYCYYNTTGVDAKYHDIIIAVSKNNAHAGVDARNMADTSGALKGYTNLFNDDYLKNWNSDTGCGKFAVVEATNYSNLEDKLPLTKADYYIYLFNNIPVQYRDESKYWILRLEGSDSETKFSCVYQKPNASDDREVLILRFNEANQLVNSGGSAYGVVESNEYRLNAELSLGYCPTIYICEQSGPLPYKIFFSDYSSEFKNSECKQSRCINSNDGYGYCNTKEANLVCPQYSYIEDATDLTTEQKNANLKTYCTNAVSSLDYSNPCARKCVNFLKQHETKLSSNKENCGFGKKVVVWVENILRWIKYIVPVILIVLSILDFMKALAAEKEDEMKKAQKHFVIRLIAAVLIFLMPIILSFVMEKMGFSAESCGIKGLGF